MRINRTLESWESRESHTNAGLKSFAAKNSHIATCAFKKTNESQNENTTGGILDDEIDVRQDENDENTRTWASKRTSENDYALKERPLIKVSFNFTFWRHTVLHKHDVHMKNFHAAINKRINASVFIFIHTRNHLIHISPLNFHENSTSRWLAVFIR